MKPLVAALITLTLTIGSSPVKSEGRMEDLRKELAELSQAAKERRAEYDSLASVLPSEWSDEQKEKVQSDIGIGCDIYRQGHVKRDGAEIELTRRDTMQLEFMFRDAGMNGADIMANRRGNGSIVSGQTFLGFICSRDTYPKINKSYYSGSGHHWQVLLGKNLYFEGDGTDAGMILTGWN